MDVPTNLVDFLKVLGPIDGLIDAASVTARIKEALPAQLALLPETLVPQAWAFREWRKGRRMRTPPRQEDSIEGLLAELLSFGNGGYPPERLIEEIQRRIDVNPYIRPVLQAIEEIRRSPDFFLNKPDPRL